MKKCINGVEVELSEQEEMLIQQEWSDNKTKQASQLYLEQRRIEYPSITDSIDNIYKALKFIKDNSVIELPNETKAWIDNITSIKEQYKPSTEIKND